MRWSVRSSEYLITPAENRRQYRSLCSRWGADPWRNSYQRNPTKFKDDIVCTVVIGLSQSRSMELLKQELKKKISLVVVYNFISKCNEWLKHKWSSVLVWMRWTDYCWSCTYLGGRASVNDDGGDGGVDEGPTHAQRHHHHDSEGHGGREGEAKEGGSLHHGTFKQYLLIVAKVMRHPASEEPGCRPDGALTQRNRIRSRLAELGGIPTPLFALPKKR